MSHEIDPLTNPRWPEFLRGNPQASVFHSRGWLEAVYRTYGYRPAVITTSPPNSDLANGLVFCRVRSCFTGRRFVALPFSDHCDPLVRGTDDLLTLLSEIERQAQSEGCSYVELRPVSVLSGLQPAWHTSHAYCLHRVDLRLGAEGLFRRFHRNCVQRRIRHAEKEGIAITEGRDAATLGVFYDLFLQTRRRHGLPPPPIAWFRNILTCLSDSATIRCAHQNGQPVAAILTLQCGTSLYYKYGASLTRFHRLAATPYLLWHAIQDAIRKGLEVFDLGRSDYDNHGLITFKDRWNSVRSLLAYIRSPANAPKPSHATLARNPLFQTACRYMPDNCLTAIGHLSYRHIE